MRTMWDVLREDKEKGIQAGLQEGLQEGQRQIVCFMAQQGDDLEKISRCTGLPMETVQKLLVMPENPAAARTI